jgi:hypothetical protein
MGLGRHTHVTILPYAPVNVITEAMMIKVPEQLRALSV